MRITRLEAKGIGPFEDLNIEFKPKPAGMEDKAEIHILTGENGTGKSTILMMLASIADSNNDNLLVKRLHIYENIRDDIQSLGFFSLEYSHDNKRDIEDLIKNTNEYKDYSFSLFSKPDSKRRMYFFTPKNQKRLNQIKNLRFTKFAGFAYSGFRNTISSKQKDIINTPFKEAINFEKTINTNRIIDWVKQIKIEEAVSYRKGKMANASNISQNLTKIERTLGKIIEKRIEFDLDDKLNVFIKIEGKNLDFDVLPDGLKAIISWLADLFIRLDAIEWSDRYLQDRFELNSPLSQNFILFLDEIEVHLHPSWQRKILPVVQDLFPNAQIFISTHSPFVVGSVDGARVYKFKLDENNNSVLDSEYWTEDGNSYQYYLREVFDIKNEFGVKIDESLQELQRLKEKALKGSVEDYEKFMILSDKLLNENPNSVELSSIVGFERRKLEKQFPTQPVTV